jgi:hypothetical protein
MTERIAKGRFHWARLVVTLNNGDTIYEDRSDPHWWNNLDKKWISSLSVQITNPHSLKHTLKASKNHNYQFFHYKKRKMFFSGGADKQPRDVAFAIGMVTDKSGDCQILEVRPDGSVFAFKSNVVEAGRNLDLHGIKLEEIY